jgi:SPP1 family predicted phage head-tail adaptor
MACCDIKMGELRHKIDIERAQLISDGIGGSTKTWASIGTPWAKIKPMRGGERLQAMRIEATISHVITIRYKSGYLPSDRVNYNGRIMQIRAVINIDERNKWIELYCDEGAPT